MKPGELYLDVLFPLVVRRSPGLIIAPPELECTLLLLSPYGPTSATRRSPGDNKGTRSSVDSGFLWLSAYIPVRIRSDNETWALVIGKRLIDQLVISAFGEPGFSRFLDEIADSGSAPFMSDSAKVVDEQCVRLADEIESRRPAFRTHARTLLTELLLSLYRASLAAPAESPDGTYRLADIIDFIEKNYAEEISLAHLADRAGCSPSHFSRLFSREVGMPVSEFINRARIRKACLLLRRGDRSISDIAYDVGYNNISFFNRYFRKLMNMTPREYRKYVQQ